MSIIKWGVFLARMQPLHKAHLYLIEKALKQNDRLLIVLGSANKEGMIRNPFDVKTRAKWLRNSLKNSKDYDRITIMELPDWSMETDNKELHEWGHYLYYNIVSHIQCKEFSIYYSDNIEIIRSWFDNEVAKHITVINYDRNIMYDNLSATKIRQAIIEEDNDYLTAYLPEPVLNDIAVIRDYLKAVKKKPKEDFSMA